MQILLLIILKDWKNLFKNRCFSSWLLNFKFPAHTHFKYFYSCVHGTSSFVQYGDYGRSRRHGILDYGNDILRWPLDFNILLHINICTCLNIVLYYVNIFYTVYNYVRKERRTALLHCTAPHRSVYEKNWKYTDIYRSV